MRFSIGGVIRIASKAPRRCLVIVWYCQTHLDISSRPRIPTVSTNVINSHGLVCKCNLMRQDADYFLSRMQIQRIVELRLNAAVLLIHDHMVGNEYHQID